MEAMRWGAGGLGVGDAAWREVWVRPLAIETEIRKLSIEVTLAVLIEVSPG
jgi:hypothetical protein